MNSDQETESSDSNFDLILEDVSEPEEPKETPPSSESLPNSSSQPSETDEIELDESREVPESAPTANEKMDAEAKSVAETPTETPTESELETAAEPSAKPKTTVEPESSGATEKTGDSVRESPVKNADSTPSQPSAILPQSTVLNLREDAIVRAIRSARPAVVNIRGEKVLHSIPYDASGTQGGAGNSQDGQHVNGMGTGVLFDPRGYIVTNFHVVDGIEEIHVTTSETKTYVAQILARDKETDLAIIKIDALAGEVFQTLKFGESTDLMSGETVIAVGNAFGYEHTVTKGIISALHRSVQVSDVQFYQDLIQTDASINPGNSGGPLLNINGEMIGINVAVRAGAQGIGFAIPVNRAMEVVTKMVESCGAERNWHGIQFVSLPLGSQAGAVVQSVESNSPASSIGLKPGDVILAVNNQKVNHELDFACAILEQKPGEAIRLTVSRNQKRANVRLAMGAVSRKNHVASEFTPDVKGRPLFDSQKLTNEEIVWKELGVLTASVAGNKIKIQGEKQYNGGLLVQNVRENSPASRQGIRNGDILLGILRWETLSLDNLIYVLKQPEIKRVEQIKFLLARNGKVMMGHFSGNDFIPESALTTASAASPVRK